jgi:hypothetical protein
MVNYTTKMKIASIVLIFVAGAYFTYNFTHKEFIETFVNEKAQCFNLLIKKDSAIYLYNSEKEYVPGINPLQFNNLEEYTEYIEWERAKGLNCPVLFLQHEYDAQNNSKYKLRPSPHNPEGGLNTHAASKTSETILNNLDGSIAAFNEILIDIEANDEIGGISKPRKSANAMDPNWGGPDYTRKQVDDGTFGDRNSDTRFDLLYRAPKQGV